VMHHLRMAPRQQSKSAPSANDIYRLPEAV